MDVWLLNCEVFIFVDQTAKFVCEARVTDVAYQSQAAEEDTEPMK